MAELQVGIRADVSEAKRVTRALKEIKKEAGTTGASLAATGKAAKGASVSLQTTVSASGQLATSQNLAAVANVRAATTLKAVGAAAAKTSVEEAAATVQTTRLTGAFARLKGVTTGLFAGPTAGLKRFGTQARTAAGSIAGLSTAAAGFGALVAVGFGIGVKSAVEFELTLSRIEGLVGIAASEVEAFKKPLLDIAKATGKGPNELAEALFFVTSAGFEGKEALEVLEASAKAAAAGLGETKQVADAVTSAVNAYGIENLSAAQATDILVATVREGKAEADSIAGALGQILPSASELGVEFEELGGTIAALTRIGLGADQGATALGATLAAIQAPGQEAEETLAKFGTSATELRRAVREDGLLVTLQKLNESFGDNEEALTSVFPNIRALRAILPLVGKNAGDVADIFEEVANSTDAAQKAFDVYAKTTAFDFKQSQVVLQTTLLKLGDDILPAVTLAFVKFAEAVEGTTEFIRQFSINVAEFFVGTDDPLKQAQEQLSEVRASIRGLDKEGLSDWQKSVNAATNDFFGIEVANVKLEGSLENQLQLLRDEETRLEQAVQLNKELLDTKAKQTAAAEAEVTAKKNAENIVIAPPVDEDRLKKGLQQLEALREEVTFLNDDLVTLQEIGQEGIGLAEDASETRQIFRNLQGDTAATAGQIRKLINEKRALAIEVDKINAAFQRQNDATAFLQDLIVATAALRGNFTALASGGSLLEVESFRQAQQLASDLNGELGLTVDQIQQIILQNKAWETALKELDPTGLRDLVVQRDALIAQNAGLAEGTQAYKDSTAAIGALNDAIINNALAAEGLDPLQKILDQALSKEEQFRDASMRLRDAFNAAGIVDPDADPRFQAALENLKNKVFGLTNIFEEFGKAAAQNLQSSFADFLFDPFSDGLDGIASKFADTLKRMAADLLSTQILTSFFGSFAGAGGGWGALANAALGSLGGGQGSFAEGGNFSAGKPMLVGEQGPEIITPRRSGSVIPNDMMGGGMGAPTVEVGGPTIVNTIDDGQIVAAFNRGGGGQVVLNDMTERKSSYRQALGIS